MLCSTRGGGRKKRAADEADEEYIRLWMPMEPSHRDRQPRDTVVEISLIRETNRPMGSVQRGSAAKNPKERQFFQRQTSGFSPISSDSSRQTGVLSREESYLVLRSYANCCCIFRGKSRSESFTEVALVLIPPTDYLKPSHNDRRWSARTHRSPRTRRSRIMPAQTRGARRKSLGLPPKEKQERFDPS